MTCEHERCYSHQTVEAILAARADDLAQITAAVAALTETAKIQDERIGRLEAHRTTIIGEISRRLEELREAVRNQANLLGELHDDMTGLLARHDREAATYTADSATADVRRQTGGEQ